MRFQDALLIDFGVIRGPFWSQKGVKKRSENSLKKLGFFGSRFLESKMENGALTILGALGKRPGEGVGGGVPPLKGGIGSN